MEQLVHLRLKSIYKAFKQSSSSVRAANVRERQNDDPDESHVADDPEAFLQAAAMSAKSTAKSHERPASRSSNSSTESVQDKMERYMAEKEKADAAAAALLAELEVEENAAKSKKSKKKRKKERQQAKREEERQKEELKPPPKKTEEYALSPVNTADLDDDDEPPINFLTPATEPTDAETNGSVLASESEFDRLLCKLVDSDDVAGLEELLASLKGVPGKAVLRKNVKKALKRLRTTENESDEREVLVPTDDPADGRQSPSVAVDQVTVDPNGTELVKIVSHPSAKQPQSPSGKPRGQSSVKTECVLQIASSTVGFVIGKGGQRIRDLMEENGVRIWIDQENLSASDPRLVYISGPRANVDSAARQLTDLINNAPCGTTSSKQNRPSVESKQVQQGASRPLPATTHPRQGATPRRDSAITKSEQVMTCDARFVPLLIGRRGWTIKNIQDSSGSRVDIDQTVTPRKITITGYEANVEIAAQMVSDVLSYPHAQLQYAAGDETVENADVAEALPEELLSPREPKRLGTSPPSSLIMPGDANSTISASSSLSSTPEPSTTESRSAATPLIPSGPMLPPSFAFHQCDTPAGRSMHSVPIPPHASSPGQSHDPLYGLAARSPEIVQQHSLGSPAALGMGQSASAFQPRGSQINLGLFPGDRISVSHHQLGLGSPQGSFALSGGVLPNRVPTLGESPTTAPIAGQGLWARPRSGQGPVAHSLGGEGFRLDAAMEFLQNSNGTQGITAPLAGGVSETIGLPSPAHAARSLAGIVVENGSTATAVASNGANESAIVDSLFGPPAEVETKPSLLAGLKSLSIGNEDIVNPGLWVSKTARADGMTSLPQAIAVASDVPKDPLYGAVPSNDHHPSHSRFAWGGFSEDQQ